MTIIDVAKIAGVSKSTVSRVINGHTTVAPDVARQVKTTMEKMGYRPSANRRGPKPVTVQRQGLETGNIGFLILGRTRELLESPSMARMLASFSETTQRLKVRPVIIEMPDPSLIPDSIRNADIDGLVIIGRDITPDLADIFHPIPIVWQGGIPLDIPLADHILINGHAIGVMAAEYMLQHGAQDLAYLNHDTDHLSFPLRFASFKEIAEKKEGVSVRQYEMPSRAISESDMWSTTQIRSDYTKLIDKMLANGGIPDGIFTPTDQQCAMVHTILRERGIAPRKDVITISCNNDAQWLATMHPRPATIDLRTDEQGSLAVKRLLDRIENPTDDPVVIMVTPKVIAREK